MKMCSSQSLSITSPFQLSSMYINIIEIAFNTTNNLENVFKMFRFVLFELLIWQKILIQNLYEKRGREFVLSLYYFMNLCFSVSQEDFTLRNDAKSDALRAFGCFHVFSVLMCQEAREMMLQGFLIRQLPVWLGVLMFVLRLGGSGGLEQGKAVQSVLCKCVTSLYF